MSSTSVNAGSDRAASPRPLNIQIVFRTPVGGLFRHVRDLARGLHEAGQKVGIICDSMTGGEMAERQLADLSSCCGLGVARLPMPRLPGAGDLLSARAVARHIAAARPDIIHGHGAKGGLYARLAGRQLGVPSIYVPHGGSLHYQWGSPAGTIYLATERLLRPLASGLHFVCQFERDEFARKVGLGNTPWRVVHNGLWPEEFVPVAAEPAASDIVFVGELRHLKGTDVLLHALSLARAQRPVTATIVGDGPDRRTFEALSSQLGLGPLVRFAGALPALKAFSMGRIFVMPSRAESFPYVVLEAAAAGLPILASRVGGIPEILPPHCLVEPGDAQALSRAILSLMSHSNQTTLAPEMKDHLQCQRMVSEILHFYRDIVGGGRR